MSYAVTSSFEFDYSGESEIIPDILSSQAFNSIKFGEMTFVTMFIDDTMAKRWRRYITNKCQPGTGGKRRLSSHVPPELELQKSLIHEACRSCVDLDSIKILLRDKHEQDSIEKQGKYGRLFNRIF